MVHEELQQTMYKTCKETGQFLYRSQTDNTSHINLKSYMKIKTTEIKRQWMINNKKPNTTLTATPKFMKCNT